jgi:hypothetical protein
VLAAEWPSTALEAMLGLQSTPTDMVTKSHRRHRGARAEAPARPAGVDQAARVRSTERSSAAMAILGGEVDESPWLGGSTRRGGADAP